MQNVPFFNFFRRAKTRTSNYYREERIGTLEFPEKLNDKNAFTLAQTVTEIFWPIDFCADRISKLRFYIAGKDGKEVTNTELNRFLSLNPFFSFNDLVYQKAFSWFADGNAYNLLTVPENLKTGKITVTNITRSDIIQPNTVSIDEYTNIPLYKASNYSDIIRQIRIAGDWKDEPISPEMMQVSKIDSAVRDGSSFLGRSALYRGLRPINNLLATYSARYNSYVNNGSAGLLVRKGNGTGAIDSLTEAVSGGANRDKVIEQINDRKGLTGSRQFWGITDQPIEFINTIASIKDLMPMEETLEDSIKIAAIMQIPAGLVPRKDGQTFDNQQQAERAVWENTLMSLTDSLCKSFTKEYRLDTVGYSIKADYSSVSALSVNKKEQEEIIELRLRNLKALQEAGADVSKEIDEIMKYYGEGKGQN